MATPTAARPSPRLGPTRLLVTAGLAVSTNLVGARTARTAVDAPSTFVPLRPSAVAVVTILALVAVGLAAAVARRSFRRPRTGFVALVTVGLAVSLLPLVGMGAGAEAEFRSPSTVATLAVGMLHVVPALLAIVGLAPALPVARGPEAPDTHEA